MVTAVRTCKLCYFEIMFFHHVAETCRVRQSTQALETMLKESKMFLFWKLTAGQGALTTRTTCSIVVWVRRLQNDKMNGGASSDTGLRIGNEPCCEALSVIPLSWMSRGATEEHRGDPVVKGREAAILGGNAFYIPEVEKKAHTFALWTHRR